MFVTNHVLAGTAIGLVSEKPWNAFNSGLLSHLAMDFIPHAGFEDDPDRMKALKAAKIDGTIGLVALTAATLYARKEFGVTGMMTTSAGILGAVFFDLENPWQYFTGGKRLFPKKMSAGLSVIQTESPETAWTEVAALSVLTATVVGAALWRKKREKRQEKIRNMF